MAGDRLDELRRTLDWLRSRCERRYGCAVWDVRCREDFSGTEFFISGYVLLASQRRAVERAVANNLPGKVAFYCAVEALADSEESGGTGWGHAKDDIVNVYSGPPRRWPASDGWGSNLSTQIKASDAPFRVLLEQNGSALVQLADRTLGWVRAELIELIHADEEPAHADESGARASSKRGDNGGPLAPRWDFDALIEKAKEHVGIPYVPGGVTKSGIDCSGLVQKLYRDALGIVLPRHSRDQMLAGRNVSFERRRPGDLIFLSQRGVSGLHVGLLDGGGKVIHASGRRGRVIVEEIAALPSSINVVQVRRQAGSFETDER